MTFLVSIVIPTYNRAHFVGETLNSVLAQTHQNWECIIVDDGSTDNTEDVIKKFLEKDKRFQFYKRPDDRVKGPNACRNYGFEKTKGDYINFFDDDDLMVTNRVELQLKNLIENNLDFNVCKHKDFIENNNTEFEDKHLRNIGQELTLENFINNTIFFATTDFFCTRKSIEALKFDEGVLTGQEYQIFCQYLMEENRGMFINEFLSLRRIHDNSVQIVQKNNPELINKNKFKFSFRTYLTIENKIQLKEKKILVKRAAVYYLSLIREKDFLCYQKDLLISIKKLYGYKIWFQYFMALNYLKHTNKAKYRIKKYFKKVL